MIRMGSHEVAMAASVVVIDTRASGACKGCVVMEKCKVGEHYGYKNLWLNTGANMEERISRERG